MELKDLLDTSHRRLGEGENYESMVDLFTLISLALIFATIIYGIQQTEAKNTLDVYLQEVEEKSGSTNVIPDDAVLVLVTEEGSSTVIVFVDNEGRSQEQVQTPSDVSEMLKSNLLILQRAKSVTLILDRRGEMKTYAIFSHIQDWLTSKNITDTVSVAFWK